MRELTVRIRFSVPCLGNVKRKEPSDHFAMPRNQQGLVIFLASWHHANMRLAAQLLSRHQDEVAKIHWDIAVDGVVSKNWYRRYYCLPNGRRRYSLHEAFFPGQLIGINCAVPTVITDEDLWRLLSIAGRYRGLSPWKPGEFGIYEVESVRSRHVLTDEEKEKMIG